MAISGCFKDVKFIEVLKIVARRTGRLWVYNFSSNLYAEWFVHEGSVRAVRLNKTALPDRANVLQAVSKLSKDTESSYIFYNLTVDRIPSEVLIPINEINLDNAKTISLEPPDPDFLPNPETKFTASPTTDVNHIPLELREFYDLCRAGFADVLSATEAADLAAISLVEAQTNFYKLRALKFIQPVRAVARTKQSAIQSAQTTAETPPVNGAAVDSSLSDLIRADAAQTPRKSLIQRMLQAITNYE